MKKILLFTTLFISFTIFSQEENLKPVKTDSTNTLERVPIYNGCNENLTNRELLKCMSESIDKLVAKSFNIDIVNTHNLPVGIIRIHVQFKVDTLGNVIEARAEAPHTILEEEAIRVVKLIPKLKPGFQDGKAVVVPYAFPIKFQIEGNKKDKRNNKAIKLDKYPTYRGCNEDLDYLSLKKCTSDKIKNYIKLSFNMELADKLFPLEKSTQFMVEFVIDENGKAKNINAKAHKREIAAEAIKVVKRLPKLKKPGYLNGKPVAVPYKLLLTIYF